MLEKRKSEVYKVKYFGALLADFFLIGIWSLEEMLNIHYKVCGYKEKKTTKMKSI